MATNNSTYQSANFLRIKSNSDGLYINGVRYRNDDQEVFRYSYTDFDKSWLDGTVPYTAEPHDSQTYSFRLNERGQLYLISEYTQAYRGVDGVIKKLIVGDSFQSFYLDIEDEYKRKDDLALLAGFDFEEYCTPMSVFDTVKVENFLPTEYLETRFPELFTFPGSAVDKRTVILFESSPDNLNRDGLLKLVSYLGGVCFQDSKEVKNILNTPEDRCAGL